MACVTKRRGRFVVDIRLDGRRVVKVYDTRREADEALAKLTHARAQAARPALDPFISFAGYVPRLLTDCD